MSLSEKKKVKFQSNLSRERGDPYASDRFSSMVGLFTINYDDQFQWRVIRGLSAF